MLLMHTAGRSEATMKVLAIVLVGLAIHIVIYFILPMLFADGRNRPGEDRKKRRDGRG